MTTYTLAAVPPLLIGADARLQAGALAASLAGGAGATVLLVADPGLEPTGLVAELEGVLRDAELKVVRFTDLKSDPTVAQADAAAALARQHGVRAVVALGGGSALDLGKAVAAVAGAEAPATTYALAAAPLPATRLKVLCLPTTAGTGSETTRVAILSDPDGAKLWFWGEELRADAVVLDPVLTATLPAALTAATGLDALVHAVEAATNRNATPGNDVVAHAAIRLIGAHLETAVREPGNLEAREALLRGAALAGTAIDNAGTAMAHAFGHAMASLVPMHHGRAVALAMRASLPFVVGNDEAGRFAACAAALGAEPSGAGFIAAFEALLQRTGFDLSPGRLAELSPERLAAQVARPENMPMVRSTGRQTSDADLLAIARAVLSPS